VSVSHSSIPEVRLLEPRAFEDDRGFLCELYNERELGERLGTDVHFVQQNLSHSKAHVLRGLHYQIVRPQGKLVRASCGEIFDVAVDLRRSSPSFGHWVSHVLSAANRRMVWVPPGFAHGFLVTGDSADVEYHMTDYRAPELERCIAWDDPRLGIAWPLRSQPLLSARDRRGASLDEAETYP
jgi:dTDP-4-dehydrorhamnose 3,5-epimerase